MTEEAAPRRRRRAQRAAGPATTPAKTTEPAPGRAEPSRRSEDRGWRDLTGSSPSQLGVSGALRARDVARPDEDDLAAAEAELTIVRRQWTPPDS